MYVAGLSKFLVDIPVAALDCTKAIFEDIQCNCIICTVATIKPMF